MEITYIGHSSFKIKGNKVSLVIDPYSEEIGYKFPKQSCDILLVSHDHYDHNNIDKVEDYKLYINKPGEYELSEVFINGIQTFHDNKKGEELGNNTIYLITIDGYNILHLGDLGHELSKEQMERIGSVDVLMIPVGGTKTIGPEVASNVISSLEPSYVIPMHYQTNDLTGIQGLLPLSKFLDEMGIEHSVTNEEKLKISSKSNVPLETTVIVLNQKH